jgi:hypothetical protein
MTTGSVLTVNDGSVLGVGQFVYLPTGTYKLSSSMSMSVDMKPRFQAVLVSGSSLSASYTGTMTAEYKPVMGAKKCANLDGYTQTVVCSYTKPESDYIPISSGHYIEQLANQCVNNDVVTVPRTTNQTPFACGGK